MGRVEGPGKRESKDGRSRRATGWRFVLEAADGSRRCWSPQGFPPLASAAFPDSSYCSKARCKAGSCSRILPPSPSQVRKKPWVRGTEGLQGGRAATLPGTLRNHCFHFFFFFEVKITHEAAPSLPRAPPLSLGHLVVVAMETTSKMACKSTQQEQQERMGPGSEGSWKCLHPQHSWNKRLWIPRGLRKSPICNVVRDRG